MRVIAWMTMALVASPLLAQGSAKAVFDELIQEFNKARSEYIAQAQEKGERVDPKVVLEPFLERFEAGAKKYAGTDGAVPFLSWIAMNYPTDEAKVSAVVDEILAHHVESPELVQIASGLTTLSAVIGEERTAELEKQIAARGHPEVKSTMLFFSGYYALREAGTSGAAMEAALEDLRQAASLGGQYGEYADGMLFERERLQIGMEAPDIVGKDLDGVGFKLSDYRGKVVVLDFWGDW